MSNMVGELRYFCTCLLKNNKEHVVTVTKEDKCVYCGHFAISRKFNEIDLKAYIKYKDVLNKIKREHLEMIIKDRRHGEKVN